MMDLLGFPLFVKKGSGTPVFKILVRALNLVYITQRKMKNKENLVSKK